MGSGFFRSPWPILILVVLAILLFGAGKLPGLARNLGKSMRIFKSEVDELRKDNDKGEEFDESDEPRDRERPRDRADDSARDFDPRDAHDDRPLEAERIRQRRDDDGYRRD